MREKGVLLGFVEAVNLVDEDDGAVAGAGFMLGYGHDLLDFLDARENRAEGNEFGACQSGDEAGKRSFPAARRSPEEHGDKIVAFDLNSKRLAGTEKSFLADEFIKRAWPHALGERLIGGGHIGLGHWCGQFGEEAHVIWAAA